MRVLLLNSPVRKISPHSKVAPPLGLGYLASHLIDAGHEIDLIDLSISGYRPQRLNAALKRFRPDVVGISAFTETFPNAVAIAEQVKEFDPAIHTVVGGAHASILPAEVVAEPAIDFVVVGEGEAPLAALAEALESGTDSTTIPGLAYKGEAGEPVVNPVAAPLPPDDHPLPARDLFALEFYEHPFNVLTARGGCPYRCPFCSASQVWNGKHRPRDPKAVVEELRILQENYGTNYLFFVDDIFTLRRDWVMELMEEMKSLSHRLEWGCGTRVDRVDPELLAAMAEGGCVGIQYGVESGAQGVLDSVKGIDRQSATDAITWTVEVGIRPTASFMVPFPDDTEETIRETFEFMRSLSEIGAEVLVSYTTPYPGTTFYNDAESLGLTILSEDWGDFDAKHSVMDTKHLSADDVERIVVEEVQRIGMQATA